MTVRIASLVVLLALHPLEALAQGPLLSYLTDPATQLPWASCEVYFDGGSRLPIPFLPLIASSNRAPLGSRGYAADIHVDAPVVFVGDGVIGGRHKAYDGIDVAGQAVMFAFDAPEDAQTAAMPVAPLESRIREAASRKAAAVIVFSTRQPEPWPMFRDDSGQPPPDIPAIVLRRNAASALLGASGFALTALLDKWQSGPVLSRPDLIIRIRFRIAGAFSRIDGQHFSMAFEPSIDPNAINRLAIANEKSVGFLGPLFRNADARWRTSRVTYFRNFDSKLFYTHHLGRGLSSDAGVFSVFDATGADFGLAVHENTHTLLNDNWGGSTSFMSEGMARYAESQATDADRDHRLTASFIRGGRLFGLTEMIGIAIGSDQRTEVAYPASGSFVGYLVSTYGLPAIRDAYRLEAREAAAKAGQDSWSTAFKKPLTQLEADWLRWLGARSPR